MPVPHSPFTIPNPQFTITLRLATTADAHPLHQGCYPQQPWRIFEEQFQRSLRRQTADLSRYLLAQTAEGDIIGTAQLHHYPSCAEIADVYVAEALRGRGLGTQLIHHLEQLAQTLGWFPLEIGVEESNGRALALYQRLGYTLDRPLRLPATPLALILRKEAIG
jgi:GNAT superfamily N-acetyltransferase